MNERNRQSVTVIVVDDDAALRSVFARTLRYSYPQTFAVARADEAETLLEAMEEDERAGSLVLMDVSLHPGDAYPDGCEAGRAIARRWPMVRMLFMSGHGAQGLLDRCPGHPPYIIKPMVSEVLVGTVRAILHAPPWKPLADHDRRKGDR